MATVEDILLPDIGDFADVEVIEILVAPGDRIDIEQSILSLESDKATIEIPSPKRGVVEELKVKLGDRVSQGDLLLTLRTEAGTPHPQAPKRMQSAAPATPATDAPKGDPTPMGPEATTARFETISVVLPDIGDFNDIPVIEVLVAPGDPVSIDQSLLTLESEKATMEIPSPNAGIVEELAVKIGDTLSQGDLILTLRSPIKASATDPAGGASELLDVDGPFSAEETDATAGPSVTAKPMVGAGGRAPGEAERRPAPVLPRPADMAAIAKGRKPHASPAVRRFARQLGVDLTFVKGSGPKGRALKEDVQQFVKQTLARGTPPPASALPFALPAAPEIDFAKFGAIEISELPRIKKLSGRHLHRCWISVPHVTQFDEADITELDAFRRAQQDTAVTSGVKLTLLPFVLKAVATALARMPILKASLSPDGERLITKHYTHIGVAVETPNGLVVPVVRDVDHKGIHTLAHELAELSDKARNGKLLPGDMQGGCFSISSLGSLGGTAFTPIVNAPEVAILGLARATMKPVWNGETFAPRLILPLSLSYDHRVVDGADGVRFTALLASLLADLRRLLL